MSHRYIKNRDIVLFSFQPWNCDIAFNFKDMAYELARHNRVLFVDRALDRNTAIKNKFFAKKEPGSPAKSSRLMEKIQEDFWVLHPQSLLESGNWSPSYKLFDFFNRINNNRLAVEIKSAIRNLGFKEIILINDNDFFRGLYLKDLLPCHEYIFYIRDFLTISPFFKKFGPECERRVIERSDLVVANSAYLAAYAGQWNPNSVDIGQGCNLQDFLIERKEVPDDLARIPGPVIGYFGSVNAERLSEEVLLHIAASFPQYSVVLVGPLDLYFEKSALRNCSNVYFLGPKKPEESPAYIQHFDVCINPQSVNPLTIGNYPRKIDEYLVTGKPVVATATDAMEMFSGHTFLCETKEDYVKQIRKIFSSPEVFSETQKEARRNFALEHTWENSIGCLGDAFYQTKRKLQPVQYE
jgi:teichuronic acid biosynthesis glycosyltransferase TuaH